MPASGAGTIDDLLKDAHKAGYPATRRLVTDWAFQGLLHSPTRRGVGRGKGTTKGIYSAEQRQLFMALLQHRAKGSRIAALSNIPVALWLYWGDSYVPLRQTRRALATWIEAAERRVASRSTAAARELVELLATPDTDNTHRNRLLQLLDDANRTGRVANPEALEEAIDLVFDPSGNGRPLGPPGASISPEILVQAAVLQSRGFLALAGRQVEDRIFEQARAELQRHLVGYIGDHPQLIAAADTSVGHLFTTPLAQQVIPSACPDLIREIGRQLSKETRNDSNT